MKTEFTPGPWHVSDRASGIEDGFTVCIIGDGNDVRVRAETSVGLGDIDADARLIAAAPELLEALQKAAAFIDVLRQELHHRRVGDWYPEAAHNAASAMSEDMRLLGNACADFNVSEVLAKATGEQA